MTTTAATARRILVVTSEDSHISHVAVWSDRGRRTLCGRTGRLLEREYASDALPGCMRCRAADAS